VVLCVTLIFYCTYCFNGSEYGIGSDRQHHAPQIGYVIGSLKPVGAGVWISIDVTAYITGNGSYNFALTTSGSTAVSLASRQAGANAPQLIVETTP
jgi:hypothetical protein